MTNTEQPHDDSRPADACQVQHTVRPCAQAAARKMRQTAEDNYVADSGHRMQREYGLTPMGNPLGGRWVLRGPDAAWVDCDQYRHDLLDRHGFETA